MYDAGEEPDPRFSLAERRAFLAWVRTTLAMLAGAVALDSLGVPSSAPLRTTTVVALVLFGGSMTALAYVRSGPGRARRCASGRAAALGLGLWVTTAIVLVAVLLAVALAVSPG